MGRDGEDDPDTGNQTEFCLVKNAPQPILPGSKQSQLTPVGEEPQTLSETVLLIAYRSVAGKSGEEVH